MKLDILKKITDFYLTSGDYNGLPTRSIVEVDSIKTMRKIVSELVSDELVSVVYGDCHPNPHIKALEVEPVSEQIKKIPNDIFEHACLYPESKHLEEVVDKNSYADRPFELCLALGEPQLKFKSFEISVLEQYRNDPRFYYDFDDISWYICISNDHFDSDNVKESDKVLLKSFGVSIDHNKEIYIAAFNRYLAKLSPEHQQYWNGKLVNERLQLHPDYFRTSIVGEFPERMSLYRAVLTEMQTINVLSKAIGREQFFINDFKDDNRPREFGYLLRPSLRDYNNFVCLLDKMLSDNINKKFFNNDVSLEIEEERKDGKLIVRQKGTIRILEDWIRKVFHTKNQEIIDEMVNTFKRVRAERQKPSHAVVDNIFDKNYLAKQREIMKLVYRALKTLRCILHLHPAASSVKIDEHLENELIWPF